MKLDHLPEMRPGVACIQIGCGRSRRLLLFEKPVQIFSTDRASEIPEILDQIETETEKGLYSAGLMNYEASSGLDAALPSIVSGETTPHLLWFGLYPPPKIIRQPPPLPSPGSPLSWEPSINKEAYLEAVEKIRSYISSGDCYQANFTFSLDAEFDHDVWPLFLQLLHSQQCRYGALIHTGSRIYISASPELFYKRRGNRITCRPMKGTLARKPTYVQDQQQIESLHMSEKDRAENLMIVDMIRNDLGKIANSGSVKTGPLFEVESYPTVHQLVSHVECKTQACLTDTMKALFPCASVTGAPKKRSMEILCDLEKQPRQAYTGSIGFIAPGNRHRFNVAIRTLEIDPVKKSARYGTGSGIVWDSVSGREFEECMTKTRVLTANIPEFEILETMLCEDGHIFLLDLHCERMKNSAGYFGFLINPHRVRSQLAALAQKTAHRSRFRVRLSRTGELDVAITEEVEVANTSWQIGIGTTPIDSNNPFYSHKTTNREIYTLELDAAEGANDVILYNEQHQVTETCLGNILFRKGHQWRTPPERQGMLPGVYRQYLLQRKEIQEEDLPLDDLNDVDELMVINSVRKKIAATLIQS